MQNKLSFIVSEVLSPSTQPKFPATDQDSGILTGARGIDTGSPCNIGRATRADESDHTRLAQYAHQTWGLKLALQAANLPASLQLPSMDKEALNAAERPRQALLWLLIDGVWRSAADRRRDVGVGRSRCC